MTPDGSGSVVRTRGDPPGRTIPPVSKEVSRLDIMQLTSVVEPEPTLLQSTVWPCHDPAGQPAVQLPDLPRFAFELNIDRVQ